MGKAGGKLPKSGEAFGTAGLSFGFAELAVGLLKGFGKSRLRDDLAPVFDGEAVHEYTGEKEKQNADSEDVITLGCYFIFRLRRNQKRQIGKARDGCPKKGAQRAEIDSGADHRQVVDRVVAAVDADLASVVEKQSGEPDLDQDRIRRAATRIPSNEPALENLGEPNGQEYGLLVKFVDRRKKSKREKKKEEDSVDPTKCGFRAVDH